MKRKSLGLRLGLLALAGALVVLVLVGTAIAGLLRNFVVETYDTNLNATLVALMANTQADPELGTLSVNVSVADPRFEQPFSGWYWQIADGQTVLLRSGSLWTETLQPPPTGTLATGPGETVLHMRSRTYTAPGGTGQLVVTAAMPQAEIDADVRAIVWPLALSLGLLGLGLALAIIVQIRVGLKPVRQLSVDLRAIRTGEIERLPQAQYAEIAPLVDEINTLLDANARTIARARTHVGNLAHGLKTPLSVLTTESADPALPDVKRTIFTGLAERMDRLISHHLRRARSAATLGVSSVRTPIKDVTEDLAPVFAGVYAEKNLDMTFDVSPDLVFAGERQDLEELLGNLIDNACKWARGAVHISATRSEAGMVEITIGDDGPGMSPQQAQAALQWGKRFDEGRPGAGLGLAIVADLAALYGGALVLEPHGGAPMTGARAILTLPSL